MRYARFCWPARPRLPWAVCPREGERPKPSDHFPGARTEEWQWHPRRAGGTRVIREWQGVEHCVISGPPIQIAVRCRSRDHRHALEWARVFRLEKSAGTPVKKPVVRKLRCAVYTRKSSEEGLDMEFNSLDAQREACDAYVASQKAEGWLLVPDRYDDGGFSGGTLERPALQRLIADIEARRRGL